LADFRARAALDRPSNFARQELKCAVLSDIKIDNQLITAQMSRIAGCKMQHQNNRRFVDFAQLLEINQSARNSQKRRAQTGTRDLSKNKTIQNLSGAKLRVNN
jgi:hypothetical protein